MPGPTRTTTVEVPAPEAGAGSGSAAATPEAQNKITISVVQPKAPGTGYAKRCALGGDPLVDACSGGGSLAVDAAGTLYLATKTEIRRYRRVDGEGCRFDPDGDPIAMPAEPVRSQRIDGPVFMRSGGPSWRLEATADAVYAFDYLGGLYRVDKGSAEPVCTDVFGYDSLAPLGKKLLVTRRGIEQVIPGNTGRGTKGACTVRSAKIDDKAREKVHAIRGTLYAAAGDTITRYDGATAVPLGEGADVCYATTLVGCGDSVCVADNNCMKLVQLGADGKAMRTMDGRSLFDTRPYALHDAATTPEGGVLLLVNHRDDVKGGSGSGAVCESAVYALPAALFAN